MPNQKPRSGAPSPGSRSRSNSLQRMLDLEKHYMLERMHVAGVTNATPSRQPPSPRKTSFSLEKKYPAVSPQLASPDSSNDPTPWPQPLSRPPRKDAGGYSKSQTHLPSHSQTSPKSHHPPNLPSQPRCQPSSQSQPGSRTRPAPSSGPPQLQLDLHLLPLTIPTGDYRAPGTEQETPTFTPASTEKLSRQVTALPTPPLDKDLHSACQSPTWEAYARGKQEKKDKKEERREKEHMEKDNKAQKRRVISKAPPQQQSSETAAAQTPNPNTKHTQPLLQPSGSASASVDSLRPPRQQKQRPASVLGLPSPIPVKEDGAARHTRSRSSSFTSLVKLTFDLRRSSVDEPRNAGFIGGLKLDKHREAAHRKVLDDQIRAAEADIHPALRTTRPNLGPAVDFDLPATHPSDRGVPNRRAYPPITRQRAPSQTGPVLPTGSPPTDQSMISKWRARVGLKPSSKKTTTDNNNKDVVSKDASIENAPLARREEDLGKGVNAGAAPPKNASLSPNTAPNDIQDRQMIQPASNAERRKPLAKTAQPNNITLPNTRQQTSNGDSSKKETGELINTNTKDTFDPELERTSLSPPPAPPRRSSKRKSTLDLPKSSTIALTDGPSVVPAVSASNTKIPEQPSSTFGGGSSLPKIAIDEWSHSAASPWVSSRRPHTSSSEDSSSEDFHSTSSTPDTSRPQSERGTTPIFADADTRFSVEYMPKVEHQPKNPARKSLLNTNFNASDNIPQIADDDDPIQVAARKVMAAFPDFSPPQRPNVDRRSQSDPNIVRDVSSMGKLKQRAFKLKEKGSSPVPIPSARLAADDEPNSPPLRDLILTKDQSSAASPWPATYLEAARNAAPVAATPRPLNTQPTSKSLSLHTQQPLSSTFGGPRNPVRPPPAGLGINDGEGGEPFAKMFVECCGCRYYHDMPSKLYAAMANPGGVVSPGDKQGFEGAISMTVKCPWCRHEMSTRCCAGLAALVYVQERLH